MLSACLFWSVVTIPFDIYRDDDHLFATHPLFWVAAVWKSWATWQFVLKLLLLTIFLLAIKCVLGVVKHPWCVCVALGRRWQALHPMKRKCDLISLRKSNCEDTKSKVINDLIMDQVFFLTQQKWDNGNHNLSPHFNYTNTRIHMVNKS